MMEFQGFASVGAIVVIVYLIGELFRVIVKADTVNKFIPVICGFSGLVLGIASFYVAPELLSTDNIFNAAAIGIASGFAATGINQFYKQLTNNKSE